MAAVTVNLSPDIPTDAAYRANITAIHDQLVAAGWVQTADTGQINVATITTPASSNVNNGSQIFRMGDALQATAPIFLRVTYGRGPDSQFGLWMNTGTGTDGAGNLTGKGSNVIQLQSGVSGGPWPCYFSGDTNRFTFCLFRNVAQDDSRGNMIFSIERTHNADGSDNGDGLLLITQTPLSGGGRSSVWQALIFAIGAAQAAGSGGPCIMNGQSLSAADGANVGIFMISLPGRRGYENPSKCVGAYWLGDFAPTIDIPVTEYGQALNFKTLGAVWGNSGAFGSGYYNGGNSPRTDTFYAIRYD